MWVAPPKGFTGKWMTYFVNGAVSKIRGAAGTTVTLTLKLAFVVTVRDAGPAAATGAEFCWLGVNQQNTRAGKFYTKAGFEIVGTKRFLVGDQWHNDHVRRRPLAAGDPDQGTSGRIRSATKRT